MPTLETSDTPAPSASPQPASWRERIEAAFRREQLRSQQLGVRVLLVVFPIIVFWITFENGIPDAFSFYPLLAVLALLLVAPYLLRRAGLFSPWQDYAFALTYVVIAAALGFIRPPGDPDIPPQLFLTFGNEVYLFVILAASVFTFSPRVILWTGLCAAAVWSAITGWILFLPDTLGDISEHLLHAAGPEQVMRLISDPHRVHIGKWIRQVVCLLAVSGALAAFVRLTRSLVFRQTEAERERANLSRYFSQNMVDELARTDQPLGPTRSQEVAVLFVDIIGFTAWSAERTPQAVIEMLREFHGRMEQTIFASAGTVDKYIGDAVMATFGTPRAGARDATNALRCTRAMIAAVGAWNEARRQQGLEEIGIGVGAHYGPVVLGDIGGDQRLEFAVLGDTVNVASRLERLTRRLRAVAVVSDALVRAARREGDEADILLAGFRPPERQPVSGRAEEVEVWALAPGS